MIETRICTRCILEKNIEEFQIRKSRGTREWWCRDCRNLWQRENYLTTKRFSNWLSPAQVYIREYKSTHPCTDCGNTYPFWVMEFDHLRDKKAGIARMQFQKLEKVLDEIEKCELVCSNCHATRTYLRAQEGKHGKNNRS